MNRATKVIKKPQILYIDVGPLLLSTTYLDQHPDMRTVIERSLSIPMEDYLRQISLDPKGVMLLNNLSNQYNIFLFPLGSVFKRKFLIAQGIKRSCLAPEQTGNLRLDDNDMIRMMLSHAYKSNADWRVVGDLYLNEVEQSSQIFTKRYIKADNINGVTEQVIEKIKVSFKTPMTNSLMNCS
ncbi:hypothetical protein [Vibrio alginolyticus]|uniref:hypothetical protein n=1 Tax=Vibrio alginolyticus TaxID=663 RepID=UPI00374A6B3A